jgi:lysine-specific demethylase/histidyl-hydroxylase NO66
MPSTKPPRPRLAPSAASWSRAGLLDEMLAPLSREEFFRDCWEKKPVISRGRDPDFFRSLFSLADVDRFICYHKPQPGRIDLVSDAGFVRDNFVNSDKTANVNLVYESYLKGSTVILSGLEDTWEPLVIFSRALERELNHPIAVAVYLTPPSVRGVQPHFDTQENLVLQVEGSKRWLVYPPARDLPPVEGSYMPVPRESLPAPILEVEVHPGDVLYIPRGFTHEASAGDRPSLHITVDVHVRTWFDLLSDALALLAERRRELRRSLPIGFLNQREPSAEMARELAEHLASLRDVGLADVVRKYTEALIVNKPPPPDGHFAMLDATVEIDTWLEKRATTLTRLFREPGMVGIQFSGNQLMGPEKIAEALAFIDDHDSFTPAMLPGSLNDREKLVLVRRLVRTGLLTLRAPAAEAAREPAE